MKELELTDYEIGKLCFDVCTKREQRLTNLLKRPLSMYEFCIEFWNDDYFNKKLNDRERIL